MYYWNRLLCSVDPDRPKNRLRNPWFQREIKNPSCARHSENWQRKARNCYPREVDLREKKRKREKRAGEKRGKWGEIRWRRKWIRFFPGEKSGERGLWGISNPEIRVIAAGFRSNAIEAVLVHESSRRGDLVIHAGRLRDGLPNDLDSGEILALRVGGTYTLSKLQMSATGRLSSGGANRSCNWILDTVKRCRERYRHAFDCFFFKLLAKSYFQIFKNWTKKPRSKNCTQFFANVHDHFALKISRYCDKRIENVWITKDSRNIHDPWTRIVNNWASYIRIACVIVLEILHHLAGVPMWSGWSRERVGSWQRRHSSAEDGQRVHPGQQLLVYGRHAYATGQRPQPQGKRVITESGSQLLKQVMRFEAYNVWKLVGHLSQFREYICI